MLREDTSVSHRTREEIANVISGGGFSGYFPRHQYQDPVVETYIGLYAKEFYGYFPSVRSVGLTQPFLLCNWCSLEGRGVPDIALQSSRYMIISSDQTLNTATSDHYASGTSCATIVRLYPPPSSLRSALPILE